MRHIRAIFNAANRHGAETLLAQAIEKYASKAAKLAGKATVDGNLVAEAELMASFGDL